MKVMGLVIALFLVGCAATGSSTAGSVKLVCGQDPALAEGNPCAKKGPVTKRNYAATPAEKSNHNRSRD